MAEVWREERVHMKLIDAKVALDEKYSQMNKLVADLETFLKSINVNPNAKEMKKEKKTVRRRKIDWKYREIFEIKFIR